MMSERVHQPLRTRALRFRRHGSPPDVLRLDEAELPAPRSQRIRVRVRACGLNPADWALCRGQIGGALPQGIGMEVAGTVEAVGADVRGIAVGDEVLGAVDVTGAPAAGASDYAILSTWIRRPVELDPARAAALPIALESASRHLAMLELGPGTSLLVHGAGTVVGFYAVQIALRTGARVIATAGGTFAERLRWHGALVTHHGAGTAERVRALLGQAPDAILDAAPPSQALPELVRAAGDASRVLTIGDGEAAKALGVRHTASEPPLRGFQVPLAEYVRRAADGAFDIPIGETYPFLQWKNALAPSLSHQAHGKLVLLMG